MSSSYTFNIHSTEIPTRDLSSCESQRFDHYTTGRPLLWLVFLAHCDNVVEISITYDYLRIRGIPTNRCRKLEESASVPIHTPIRYDIGETGKKTGLEPQRNMTTILSEN